MKEFFEFWLFWVIGLTVTILWAFHFFFRRNRRGGQRRMRSPRQRMGIANRETVSPGLGTNTTIIFGVNE